MRYNIATTKISHQDQKTDDRRGLDAVIEAYKKDVDMTLIRENLRLTVDERFQQLMKLQQFAEELQASSNTSA